jgi:hypothetical protein
VNSEFFILFLFGAPAGILSSLLAAFGVWKKKIIPLILAGIWSAPATYYLSAASGLPLYLTALFVFGAAFAVYRNKIRLAWLLLIPLFFFAAWMTYFTLYNILRS